VSTAAVNRSPDRELSRAARAAAVLTAVTGLNAVGNLVVHVLVARSGGVDSYGAVGALLSVGIIAGTLASGIQYAVTRRSSSSGVGPRPLLVDGVAAAAPWLLLLAAAAACSPLVASYLRLGSALPVALTFTYCAMLIAYAVPAGILIGRRRVGTFALLTAATTVLRLLYGTALGWGSTDGTGPLASSALAAATATALGILVLVLPGRGVVHGRVAGVAGATASLRSRVSLAAEGAAGGVLSSLLWGAWTVPLLFARHYLRADSAGDLAAAHLMVSGILFLTAGLATAFYPSIVRSRRVRDALVGLFATAGLAGLAALGATVLGPSIIHGMYGVSFAAGRSLFAVLGLSVAAVAAATYGLWAVQALQRHRAAMAAGISFALVVEVVLGTTWHPSAVALGVAPALGCLAGLGLGVAVAATQRVRRRGRGLARLSYPVPGVEARLARASVVEERGLLGRTAVGVMVHNEAATIERVLDAILAEHAGDDRVGAVVVVASECGDDTEAVVRSVAARDARVRLLVEARRSGKANAINWFLRSTDLPICALVGGDVLLAPGSLVELVAPLADPTVGMTGAHVVPTNPRRGLAGRLVHLLWELHHEVALRRPKLGEVVAFRRVIDAIDGSSLTDEVSLEASVRGAGLGLHYAADAIVFNHGADTLADYMVHRRRIHAGHLGVAATTGYAPATMDRRVIAAAAARVLLRRPLAIPSLVAAAVVELLARRQARSDHRLALTARDGTWTTIESAKQSFHVDFQFVELPGRAVPQRTPEPAASDPA
jgi:poly-beta-1,6-N-acetyl-D-glucosamine synthase